MFIYFLFALLLINKLNSIPIKLFNDDNNKIINYNDFMKKYSINRYKNLNFYEITKYNSKNNMFDRKIKQNSIPFQVPYCNYINFNNTDIRNLDCGLRHINFIYIELPTIQ